VAAVDGQVCRAALEVLVVQVAVVALLLHQLLVVLAQPTKDSLAVQVLLMLTMTLLAVVVVVHRQLVATAHKVQVVVAQVVLV
jgi:hypothetical protein